MMMVGLGGSDEHQRPTSTQSRHHHGPEVAHRHKEIIVPTLSAKPGHLSQDQTRQAARQVSQKVAQRLGNQPPAGHRAPGTDPPGHALIGHPLAHQGQGLKVQPLDPASHLPGDGVLTRAVGDQQDARRSQEAPSATRARPPSVGNRRDRIRPGRGPTSRQTSPRKRAWLPVWTIQASPQRSG